MSTVITKFSVYQKDQFVAHLCMVDQEGTSHLVRFASHLCEKVIEMTVKEYRKEEKKMPTKDMRVDFKNRVCKFFEKLKFNRYHLQYDPDKNVACKTEYTNQNASFASDVDATNTSWSQAKHNCKYPLIITHIEPPKTNE